MACQCHLASSLSSSSFPHPKPKPSFRPPKFRSRPSITAQFSNHTTADSDGDGENADDKRPKVRFDFLKLSTTLTVISASLPQPKPALAAAVKERKRGGGGPKKSATKKAEALSPQELKSWVQGLPLVSNRVPYSELLELREKGELKHVIKPSGADLRRTAEPVLVVLEDSRVLRTMLPSVERDKKFWESWDSLSIDSLCVNAYTPPLKTPEVPPPYLGFLTRLPDFLLSLTKRKKESRRAAELRRTREDLKRQREEGEEISRKEREAAERTAKNQRREEQRRLRQEALEKKMAESAEEDAQVTSAAMAGMWNELAENQFVTLGLGIFFFYVFYMTVVLSYRKQRKDYEDRLKIEKAEAQERRKMKELQIDMAAAEEEASGEENQYLKMAEQFMKSGARVRRAQNRRPPQYLETGVDVKFEDVAGLGKIRLELEEIVKFFTHGEMYRRRGVKIPGGILLCGPPGVGKTLLAKAVAGEAGVNFFSISASQFVEIYVGVGASRVRALYQEARDNAPSVVFIDELDAVGRERGLIKGSGGQERDATLNQLLVSLDGFEGRGEVITIASTNRPDILDPALVRPGRFDRKIYIPKPGLIGRVEILKVHARKKPMAEDVDYMAVASITTGMVGAELANIVEVAAINMMRDGRTEITTDDLLQAAQMEERGMLDRKERSP